MRSKPFTSGSRRFGSPARPSSGRRSGADAHAGRDRGVPGRDAGIASPGALLAVVLLTDNYRYSLPEQTITAGLTLIVLAAVLIALLLASRIQRYLGAAGIMVITQIMGLVLAAFSVQQVLDGLFEAIGRNAH
jgi:hypothetical protein